MSDSSRLTPLEYAALAAIVVIWGVNNAAAALATQVLPPMLLGAMRFALAGVCLAFFVRPPFPNLKHLLLLAVVGGPVHFGLVYLGFALADDLSPYAVSLQLWIPFSALFSWLLLKERLSVPAMVGMAVAFAGVVFMTADPRAMHDWKAIVVGAGASAAWAFATVTARRAAGVPPLKMQAVLAFVAAPSLFLGSMLFEHDQAGAIARADMLIWASVVWAALISTVIATGLLFWLVQRREAGRVTPYLLATPVVSIAIGAGLMGDVLTPQILVGAAATIGGVGLVALAEQRMRRAALAAKAAAVA
ncbi:DMT family transporter [Caulobacter sp. 17J80-11]|uniref:DMT family transporter n=1 Tax=Caulobacter sp. 17J80-11 TaxID=2763502 RepID=UPI0016534217|nr:DMT family transporter [Caulobacter sp. 17J80-11]MBC6980612.1 DMT family transporter [Caulobacter sp. 17J80-11]